MAVPNYPECYLDRAWLDFTDVGIGDVGADTVMSTLAPSVWALSETCRGNLAPVCDPPTPEVIRFSHPLCWIVGITPWGSGSAVLFRKPLNVWLGSVLPCVETSLDWTPYGQSLVSPGLGMTVEIDWTRRCQDFGEGSVYPFWDSRAGIMTLSPRWTRRGTGKGLMSKWLSRKLSRRFRLKVSTLGTAQEARITAWRNMHLWYI